MNIFLLIVYDIIEKTKIAFSMKNIDFRLETNLKCIEKIICQAETRRIISRTIFQFRSKSHPLYVYKIGRFTLLIVEKVIPFSFTESFKENPVSSIHYWTKNLLHLRVRSMKIWSFKDLLIRKWKWLFHPVNFSFES